MEKKLRILEENNNTIIKGLKCFDLSQTLECGQCFHFEKLEQNDYVVVAYGKVLHITQSEDCLIFHDTDKDTVQEYWIPYFDLERDYSKIQEFLLKADGRLTTAINEKSGIRILNQEFHETLISFIISQNKQIPHIKQLVWRISEKYGEEIGEVNGKKSGFHLSKLIFCNFTQSFS